MSNQEQTPPQGQAPKQEEKSSLGSKIMWGALIAGAAIAIGAVVGFVYFPEQAMGALTLVKHAINSAYDAMGSAGNAVQNMIGRGEEGSALLAVQKGLNGIYEGVKQAGQWFGDKVVGGFSKQAFHAAAESRVWRLGWGESGSNTIGALNRIFVSNPVDTAGGHGLVKFIMDHSILSTVAAAFGAYKLSQTVSKQDAPEAKPGFAARVASRKASDEGFEMTEQMKKMQGLMTVQAAYAGNPEAQAMLAQQQQGRV